MRRSLSADDSDQINQTGRQRIVFNKRLWMARITLEVLIRGIHGEPGSQLMFPLTRLFPPGRAASSVF